MLLLWCVCDERALKCARCGNTFLAGIFRTAGDDDDLMTIREQVNRGTFTGCDDVHIIASLIKVRRGQGGGLCLEIWCVAAVLIDSTSV